MLPEILGCYQSQKREKMGKGAAARDFTQRINWLALRLDAARIMLFPLGDDHLPLALERIVAAKDFLAHFLPAPLLFGERLAPATLVLSRLLRDVGGQLDKAALPGDERTLYTVLQTALTAAKAADQGPSAVLAVLEAMGADATGVDAQKLAINAFGISLRKKKDFETATAYYHKALELAPDDERLLFNLARVLFEQGNAAGCQQILEQALAVDPDFAEARKFLRYVLRQNQDDGLTGLPDITF